MGKPAFARMDDTSVARFGRTEEPDEGLGVAVSMYAEFLQLALDRVQAADRVLTADEALTGLRSCRSRLSADHRYQETPAALAQELNYDVALVSLARLLGIAVDIRAFDQPMSERSRLERAIEKTGIDLFQAE